GWFLQDLMSSIADQGRNWLPSALFGQDEATTGMQSLIEALVRSRGEASGLAIAHQILRHYRALEDDDQRSAFFRYLDQRFQPDPAKITAAVDAYRVAPGPDSLRDLQSAVESPLQEFFRRLNQAPGGTAQIVRMREDVLRLRRTDPAIARVDDDMIHLLQSWFNRGFLVLQRIDWQTPAAILDKIIKYEAVHAIQGWADLRRRLEPHDRRCFAFFHPAMGDDPLIFVEVALMEDIPGDIGSVLHEAPSELAPNEMSTAVFYSISNCQAGLRGISFGNFLIKQVVADLLDEQPNLKTFVTLSPMPGFADWLQRARTNGTLHLTDEHSAALSALEADAWVGDRGALESLQPILSGLGAHYFLNARDARGRIIDPVARFHLGNGARLERVNVAANLSERGLREAHGLMVNYLYEPREIEQNHEAFANDGSVAAARGVKQAAKLITANEPPSLDDASQVLQRNATEMSERVGVANR
ncbi:MAG: malonyl-CoA decarboxylase, partial [Pseudomonadota bacterium]